MKNLDLKPSEITCSSQEFLLAEKILTFSGFQGNIEDTQSLELLKVLTDTKFEIENVTKIVRAACILAKRFDVKLGQKEAGQSILKALQESDDFWDQGLASAISVAENKPCVQQSPEESIQQIKRLGGSDFLDKPFTQDIPEDSGSTTGRAIRGLKNNNLISYRDIFSTKKSTILRTPNFGRTSYAHLREIISEKLNLDLDVCFEIANKINEQFPKKISLQ